jgi:leucyl-tRNA synthetase
MMFKAPPEDTLEWSDDGVEGAARFMRRLWRMVYEHVSTGQSGTGDRVLARSGEAPILTSTQNPTPNTLSEEQRALRRAAHATLAKVTDDLGRRRVFNTAIAAVMELMNSLSKFDDSSPQGREIVQEALELIVQMLSPIVPHASQALWKALGHANDPLIDRAWPTPDPQALVQDTIEVVVQVNGKLRGRVSVPADAADDDVRNAALGDANVQKWTEGKPIRKVIVVKGKLVNVVV